MMNFFRLLEVTTKVLHTYRVTDMVYSVSDKDINLVIRSKYSNICNTYKPCIFISIINEKI